MIGSIDEILLLLLQLMNIEIMNYMGQFGIEDSDEIKLHCGGDVAAIKNERTREEWS